MNDIFHSLLLLNVYIHSMFSPINLRAMGITCGLYLINPPLIFIREKFYYFAMKCEKAHDKMVLMHK